MHIFCVTYFVVSHFALQLQVVLITGVKEYLVVRQLILIDQGPPDIFIPSVLRVLIPR